MANSLASRRYARSLISLALDGGKLDAVNKDMQTVGDTIKENRDLQNLLNSPIVKAEKKQEILNLIFGSKVDAMTSKFIDLIVANSRENLLREITTSYQKEYKIHKGISIVEITAAVKLSDDQKKKILTMAAQQGVANAEVVEKIDPNLIGGFILRIGDKQVDASVLTQLNTMKQELTKKYN